VGAFLLLGRENGAVLRQLGQYYGRLARLKQELLGEFSRAADLPPPGSGALSLRSAIIQMAEPATARTAAIPVAVTSAPVPFVVAGSVTDGAGTALGPGTWSVAVPARPGEVGRR